KSICGVLGIIGAVLQSLCSEQFCRVQCTQTISTESKNCGNTFQYESIRDFLSSLEILAHPGADAIECFLDVLDRIGDAETQITFAEFAERGAGQSSDTGVLEERVSKLFRWPPGFLNVRKNIERAVRQLTREAFDLVQAGDHHVAAFLELVAHVID